MKRQLQLQAIKDISTLPLRYWTINKMPLVGMYNTVGTTKRPDMRFRLEMGNDQVQNEVMKHLNIETLKSSPTGHDSSKETGGFLSGQDNCDTNSRLDTVNRIRSTISGELAKDSDSSRPINIFKRGK